MVTNLTIISGEKKLILCLFLQDFMIKIDKQDINCLEYVEKPFCVDKACLG